MSTLTKVFIVVMSILAVIAAVLFIQQALTVANYMKAYKGERLAKEIADANSRRQTDEKSDLQRKNEDLRDARAGDAKVSEAEKKGLRDDLFAGQRENERLQGRLAVKDSQITAFEKTYAEQVKMTALLTTQVADREKVNTEQKEQLANLQKTVRDRDRQLERALQQVTFTAEQLAEANSTIGVLEKKIRDLQAGGAVVAAGAPATVVSTGQAIEGRVTAVDLSHNICQLNVGSASGVTRNMRFILYRGGDFVGYLVVSEVDESRCAGVLTNLQMPPQQQDRATTNLNLN